MMVAALAAAACGRLGYRERELSGDGGPPDARDGDGGGDLPDGGPGPGGCVGTLIVTTADDEADAGEVPEPPHMGAGLSLREAIAIANDRDGLDCITFAGDTSILLGSELPGLQDAAGTAIDGGEHAVSIGSSGAVPFGIRLVSDGNQVFHVEVHDVMTAIQVNGSGARLFGVRIRDCPTAGIVVAAAALDTEIAVSLLHDNREDAIQALGTTGLRILDSTIVKNAGTGISATAGAVDLYVENTLVTGNQDYGIAVDPDAAVSIDYDDLFNNRLGDCLNCTPGANSISEDPQYVSETGDDYRLMAGSTAIDAGRMNDVDVNGAADGDYNGLAPDMGAFESP
jgi:hypothetical protein